MNKFIIVFSLIHFCVFSQYKKLPLDINHYWIEKYNDLNPSLPNYPNICTYQYTIVKDTIIALKKYQKVVISNKSFSGNSFNIYSPSKAFIRQDTLLKKVYVLDNGFVERRLYDFNKNVGDTLTVYTPWGIYGSTSLSLTVNSIDSVICNDGLYHRRHNYGFIGGTSIEGVGGRHGLLTPYMANATNTSFGSSNYLTCLGVINPVSTVYSVFGLNSNCGMSVGMNEINTKNKHYVFPNPSQNSIKITDVLNTNDIKSIYAINSLGEVKVLHMENGEIDVSELSAGFYILRVVGDDTITSSSFVKSN